MIFWSALVSSGAAVRQCDSPPLHGNLPAMNRLTQPGSDGRTAPAKQILQESFRSGGARREATPLSFFLPVRYEPNYQYPLIVWLHQDGAAERQVAEIMPHLSMQNYLAVGVRGTRACDSVGHRFQWLQSPLGTAVAEEAVFAAIDAARTRYSVHPGRIYLAGYREGGTMALRVGLRNATAIDGVISLDGALPRGGRPLADLESARTLAILSAVAMEGTRYPMQTVCEDLRLWHAAKMRMDMRQYITDDVMTSEVLRDVNAWIMARVTGQSSPMDVADHATLPVEFSAN